MARLTEAHHVLMVFVRYPFVRHVVQLEDVESAHLSAEMTWEVPQPAVDHAGSVATTFLLLKPLVSRGAPRGCAAIRTPWCAQSLIASGSLSRKRFPG